MKIYTVVWSDGGPNQKHKVYMRLSDAKSKITTRVNGHWFRKYLPNASAVILESEINWTPWDGSS